MPSASQSADVTAENIRVVRAALDAINRGDMAALAATVTPDYVRDDLAGAFQLEGAGGAAALAAFITTLRTAVPDFTFEIVDIFGNEERVALQFRLTGTHSGPYLDLPPTGHAIAINGVGHYRFRDGRIWINSQLLDMAGLMRQLGVPVGAAAAAA
jgi:steroid delta-isomerase-like uncharacterized protein